MLLTVYLVFNNNKNLLYSIFWAWISVFYKEGKYHHPHLIHRETEAHRGKVISASQQATARTRNKIQASYILVQYSIHWVRVRLFSFYCTQLEMLTNPHFCPSFWSTHFDSMRFTMTLNSSITHFLSFQQAELICWNLQPVVSAKSNNRGCTQGVPQQKQRDSCTDLIPVGRFPSLDSFWHKIIHFTSYIHTPVIAKHFFYYIFVCATNPGGLVVWGGSTYSLALTLCVAQKGRLSNTQGPSGTQERFVRYIRKRQETGTAKPLKSFKLHLRAGHWAKLQESN